MNDDILKQILEELRQANQFNRKVHRFYFIFLVVIVTVMIVPSAYLATIYHMHDEGDFSEKADYLLNKDKPLEVIALAESHIKKQPQDAYGPWYLAMSHYQLGNFQDALQWLDRAQELAPTWEKDYIEPYRTAIEKKRSGKSSLPGTK